MQKITPCLWFDGQAEDAARFYTSIFKRSKIGSITRYGEGAPMPKGTALVVPFTLEGQAYIALNGGPHYKFTPAISLSVDCKTQKEVDFYWDKLCAGGGQPGPCGWLTDRYGVSWQIVPTVLPKLLYGKKAGPVMGAMMQMSKLDIAALQKASKG
jgi:predicted 3-demethylubiquinone-9 3-methyltransferase (glyoxalase superfamily)